MGDRKGRETAYVNILLIAMNVAYFLYLETVGSSEDSLFMIQHGAMFEPMILGEGQYYRLLTSVFMHFGIHHIMNNMLILFIMGERMERALGHRKYLIFYLVCGIGANVASLLFHRKQGELVVAAGASGAIFGVIGGLLYAVLINHGQLEDLSGRQLVVMILWSLYFGFTSTGIDNVAHVAGLVLGILMAILLYRRPKKTRNEWNLIE
ncbi:MAG: rhomboid family intramembrane serine protease [Hungatella sp.]